MRKYTLKIGVGEKAEFNVVGDYIRLKSASVSVRFETRKGDDFEIEAGDSVRVAGGFEGLYISHSDAAEQTIVFFVGNGSAMQSSQIGGAVSVTNFPAAMAAGGAYTQSRATVLTAGVSDLLAANAARRALLLQNNSSADAVRITVDGSAPTAVNGFRLAAGAFWELPPYMVTGQIRAIAETGAGSVVEFAEG